MNIMHHLNLSNETVGNCNEGAVSWYTIVYI